MNPVLETVLSNAVFVALLAMFLVPLGRFFHKPAFMHCLWVLILIKLVTPPLVRLPLVVPEASNERPPVVCVVEHNLRLEVTGSPVPDSPGAELINADFNLELTKDEVPFAANEVGIGDITGEPLIAKLKTSTVFSNADVLIDSPMDGRDTESETESNEPAVSESSLWAGVRLFTIRIGRWLTQMTLPLLVAWLVGSMFWYARAVLRIQRFNRLLELANPAPESLQLEIESLVRSHGLKRLPPVLVVPGSVSPMLWSFGWRTRLLLPEELLQRLPAESRQSLLLHELAHFHRGDHWVRILEFLVSGLFWWHPAVWLALREIEIAEEQCCDGWVVSRLPNGPRPYADAIMETLDFLSERPRSLPPLASGIGRVSFMKKRLTLIMSGPSPESLTGRSRLFMLVWALLLLSILPTLRATDKRPAADSAQSKAEKQPTESSVAEGNSEAQPIGEGIVSAALRSYNEPTEFETKPRSYPDELDRNWRLAISPDGKRLAVSYSGRPNPGKVRVFDIESRKELVSFKESIGIPSVGFSPDGRWLIYGRWDSVVKILDAESFEVVAELDIGWSGGSRFAVSPDSKLLATIAEGMPDAQGILRGQVKLWEMPTGKFIAQLEGDTFRFHDVSFSPDGKLLAVAGGQWKQNLMGQVNLWDVTTRKQVKTLKGHSQAVLSVTFSPDGQTIATGSRDNTIRLWNRADGSVKTTLQGHASTVERTVFSPDGKLLASTAWDGTAKLWRLADGAVLATLRGHTRSVHTAVFTPDGKTLATASEDGIVRLWNVTTGQLTDVLERDIKVNDNPEPILTVAWSSDGNMVASAHEDKTVRLRDAESGEVTRILDGHDDVVSNITFSPDGATLATASYDKLVKLWDVATGKELKTLSGHTNWVFSVAFSPDGKRLASSGYDKTVRLWNVESGAEQAKLEGHSATVRSVAFSPDGKLLITGSGDRTIRLWDVETRKELATLSGHKGSVRAVAFSPDGKTIASASEDKTVKLWDVESRKERATLSGHTDMVWSLAFSPQGKTLASGGFDNVIKLWNPQSGTERATLKGHTDVVTSLAFAPDTSVLISGSYDKSLKLWHSTQPPIPELATISIDNKNVMFVAFSPAGRYMAAGGNEKVVKIFDMKTGKLHRVLSGLGRVLRGAFSRDGKTFAGGDFGSLILIWDVESGEQVAQLTNHTGGIRYLSFSPDGKRLASSSWDGQVMLWDLQNYSVTKSLPKQSLPVNSVIFTPDGKTLITSTGNWKEWRTAGEVKFWDAETGKELAKMQDHKAEVKGLALSPDGKTLVSHSSDGQIIIWDAKSRTKRAKINRVTTVMSASILADGNTLVSGDVNGGLMMWDLTSGKRIARYAGHKKRIFFVASSPDGSLVASASGDGSVKLWPTTGGAEVRIFPAAGPWTLGVAYLPDGHHILTSRGPNNSFQMFDVETGQEVRRFEGHAKPVTALAISPDGKLAITGSQDLTVRIWNLNTGEQLQEFSGHEREPRSVAISPDGRYAVSGGFDWTIRVWNIESGKLVRQYDGKSGSLHSLFLPDSKHVFVIDKQTVMLWNIETGAVERQFGEHSRSVVCLALSPDAKRLLTGTRGNTLRLWDVETGKLLRQFKGHTEMVRCVAFSPDGRLALTGSYDKSLILWDLETGKIRSRIHGHTEPVFSVAFSPDGQFAISGSGDRTTRLWGLTTNTSKSSADLVRLWNSGSSPLTTQNDAKKND